MGLFNKLKTILFEVDDEDEDVSMPVYTKEETKKDVVNADINKETQEKQEPIVTEPINTNTRFRNVKRDIDLNFDESDVLAEVPVHHDDLSDDEVDAIISVNDLPAKIEEKKSPFVTFDEDEFERQNSRVSRNETRIKKEPVNTGVNSVSVPVSQARRINNNFSSTSTNQDPKFSSNGKYKINSGTLGNGKKPFTPSPVISPVYGILDKNYKKDDIVDRQGGMKREKIDRPIVRKEPEQFSKEVASIVKPAKGPINKAIDIDSVRKKALGQMPKGKDTDTLASDEISIEEQLEQQIKQQYDIHSIDKDVQDLKKEAIGKKENKPARKNKMLDELEKTSTLQILDDIEKELNSIKPITKKNDTVDDKKIDSINNGDTLENDLFQLIDSMYQEGEEEDND